MATDQYEDDIEIDDAVVDDEDLDLEIIDDDEDAVEDAVDYDEDEQDDDFVGDADETDDVVDEEDEDQDEDDDEDAEDDDEDDVVDLDDDEDEEDEETLEVLLGPDSEATPTSPRSRTDDSGDAPPGEGEFTCRSCFLVKRRPQLADADAMICLDCA